MLPSVDDLCIGKDSFPKVKVFISQWDILRNLWNTRWILMVERALQQYFCSLLELWTGWMQVLTKVVLWGKKWCTILPVLYAYKQKLANERTKEVWFVNTVFFELWLFEWLWWWKREAISCVLESVSCRESWDAHSTISINAFSCLQCKWALDMW